MARPSMPSSPAIAAAVVAWSPVIIRTRIPASRHSAIAALASGRGGSTMPTIASRVRSWTWSMRSPSRLEHGGIEVPLGHHHHPLARVGDPVVGLEGEVPVVVGDRDQGAVGVPDRHGARDQHVGRALDVAAHDRTAVVRGHLVEGGHELVLGVERHLGDPGQCRAGLLDVESALRPEHDQRALGGVADQALPVEHGVGAQHHRQQVGVEVVATGRRRG